MMPSHFVADTTLVVPCELGVFPFNLKLSKQIIKILKYWDDANIGLMQSGYIICLVPGVPLKMLWDHFYHSVTRHCAPRSIVVKEIGHFIFVHFKSTFAEGDLYVGILI